MMSATPSTTTTNTPTTTATTSQIKPNATLRGVVRAVNSGDSLVIQEIDPRGEYQQKSEYLLSGISAPRLGRPALNDKPATTDDAFAWDSRDYLRKKCIGKRVNFSIDYTNPASKKSNITAFLVDDAVNSLNKQMVESGWATVYKSKKPDPVLLQLETEAASKELGVHNKNPVALKGAVRPNHTINNFDLFNKLKGKQLQGLVENIRNSNTYKVVILPSFHLVQVQLSGVQSPAYKKDASGQMAPEPFAVDAETLVGNNVLHREIQLTLDTFDKQGNLFGSIHCAGKDVAEELLRQGLGTFVGWSANSRSAADQNNLKTAEQSAKTAGLRMWSTGAGASASSTSTTSTSSASTTSGYPDAIEGKVVEIGNSGNITILDANKNEHKVALASIRVPNLIRPNDNEQSKSKEEQKLIKFERYWAFEAKEWLRKHLIGKQVNAKLDFVRPAIAASELPEKPFYSVYLGKGNVSLGLVEAGLARVTEHKGADSRSIDYEALILAENKAKKRNAGLHSNKDSTPTFNVKDCSAADDKNLKTKATQLLPHIKGSLHGASIDYVFSAQRFKIYIPKESCLINFSLSGVRAPKRGESVEMDEISNNALLFSRANLHQHDVSVQIEDVDKGGNFLGNMLVNSKSYAMTLVENGFASVNDPMNRLYNQKAYLDAEDKAKKSKLGMWKNYDPEAEQRQYEAQLAAEAEKRAVKNEASEVIISSVISPTELFVRPNNSNTTDIEESLKKLDLDDAQVPNWSPKVGDLVNAQFSADNKWYRAKVQSIEGKDVRVQFYDYGNSETTTINKLKPLSAKFQSLAQLSYPVNLAYIKCSSSEQRIEDAIIFLEDEFLGSSMNMSVQSKEDNGRLNVLLQDGQGCLNAELLRNGLVKLDPATKRNPVVVSKLADEEKHALSKRLGMWEHGDVTSDDEDEQPKFGRGKGGRGGRGGRK
ncbi:nuclease domain-containing protein [Heterostelium album PN500]|uniref:Nuclease domain-containing protein n=1 Tax=Heterostelium pallidum (strain ATCC 26659 / Pp 5 / PN500) TaxID=670386 RepID=D3BTM3_HETP5|nr:nuclease domain-containing protein [Heterostelium album PN500]EFA75440.1 nuclease domain-containing protein [Heterostelium album PN500]|eukprot:XP_020427574.1 nuclease domain-containing protein [Heterostelium album PN500]